jgi:DNA-binding transcriptional ArsR family regulator
LTNRCGGHILKFVKMSKKLQADSFFKAVSDPTRRHILKLLKKRSLTAGEIAESFSITLGSLSHHYNVLKAADLVRCERRGQQIVYSLNTSVFEDAATMLADLFNLEKTK